MAHREQHSNREAKKPKKEKPKGGAGSPAQQVGPQRGTREKDDSKH